MSSDYDDLPPRPHEEDDDDTASGAMGRMFGAALWIVPLLAAGGLIGYLIIEAMQR